MENGLLLLTKPLFYKHVAVAPHDEILESRIGQLNGLKDLLHPPAPAKQA